MPILKINTCFEVAHPSSPPKQNILYIKFRCPGPHPDNSLLEVPYVVKTHFRTLQARGAGARDVFLSYIHVGVEAIPMSYRTPAYTHKNTNKMILNIV